MTARTTKITALYERLSRDSDILTEKGQSAQGRVTFWGRLRLLCFPKIHICFLHFPQFCNILMCPVSINRSFRKFVL